MEPEIVKIRSSISSDYKRKVLMKGTFVAAFGAILILYAGVFLPTEFLKQWGLLTYGVAIGLITLGLFPYRKLCLLEKKPDEIIVIENKTIVFCSKGKQMFIIPIKSIESIAYQEQPLPYGIAIYLKRPIIDKIIVCDASFNMTRFQKESHLLHHCDLFFPFFSNRGCETLQSRIYDCLK